VDFKRPLTVVTPTLDGDVLAVLAGADEEFSGRRIHSLTSSGSESGIRKAAERLVEQGIVISRRAGGANLYKLNRDHLAATYIEGLATLRAQLFDRLRRSISAWSLTPQSALVFGSVARGGAGPLSDLDLLVVRPREIDEDDAEWRDQIAVLEEIGTAWTGNETRVLEYGEGELGNSAVVRVVGEALADGIELYGSRRSLRRLVEKETHR
jgi:predicted nucleotidyltransferase